MFRKGNVTLSADLPDGFWITTIYSDKGETIYTVNNRQSGSNVFNVSLSRAPGFIEMLVQATDKERPEIDSGWTVQSPEPQGLAVVWYPLPDRGIARIDGGSRGAHACVQCSRFAVSVEVEIAGPALWAEPLRRAGSRSAKIKGQPLDAHTWEDDHFGIAG